MKFRDVLRFIAGRSDVKLDTPVHFMGNDRVHLLSEQYTPKSEFVSLTTTAAVQHLVEAWWGEFKRRDVTPTTTRSHKLFTLFKASANKPSLRPYYAADNVLPMEPFARAHMNMPWLPQAGKKLELTDVDLQHLEKQVRVSLRVVNFLESLLQAWRYGEVTGNMLEKIRGAFIHATKTQMQTQVALFCQIVQLRRDLALHGATASVEIQQQLRHAPVLGQAELFPPELMHTLGERVKRTYETSIIVQTYRKTQNQRSNENKQGNQWPQNNPKWGDRSDTGCSPSSPCSTPVLQTENKIEGEQEDTGLPHPPPGGWLQSLVPLQQALDRHKNVPVGGRLKLFWKQWREIVTPKRIYNWFRKGYRLPFKARTRAVADAMARDECPDFLLSKYAAGSVKQIALDKLVNQLLEKQAIEEVPAGTPVVFNRVFLREKPAKPRQVGKEFRLIIDLTQINQFLKLKSFHMDTPQYIRKHVEAGMWATSLDFSDAYHHIPIRRDFHKYLAFQVGSKKFWYTVCPFGLSPIPQVFTEAMWPLKWHARVGLQIMTFQYLDDWLLLFKCPHQAAQKTLEFANLCVELGLLVNLDKSELAPTQHITHLGIKWDLLHAWVQPSDKQVQNIQIAANAMLSSGKATVKMLESLQGKLVAAERQTHLGKINFRMFQRTVTQAVQTAPLSAWIRLPLVSLEDLTWWADSFNLLRGVPCIPPKPTVHITTDASGKGWGAYWESRVIQGMWSGHQLDFHINKKELLVVLFCLQEWGGS